MSNLETQTWRLRLYRAQNIGPLVEEGKYDLGITGIDWIKEPESDVAQLLDLGVGKVDVVGSYSTALRRKTGP